MDTEDQRAYENELALRAGRGSSEALEALYKQYFAAIFRYCSWQTAHSHDAEDLTQNVFVEMAKSIRRYKKSGDFRSWLYTIAKRQVNAWVKEKYQLPKVPLLDVAQDTPDWVAPENESEKKKLIRRLFRKLTLQERHVLTWRYLRSASVQECAKKLHLSVSNVKVIAHRALKKLKV